MQTILKRPTKFLIFAFALVILGGCNKATSPKKFDNFNFEKTGSEVVYPHSETFKTSHGLSYVKDKALCSQCHGSDLSGGTAQVSCKSCHTAYPHENNFSDPIKHGKTFVSSSDRTKDCFSCHKQNTNSAAGAVSCNTCHSSFPHQEGFMDPSLHGKVFQESSNRGKDCLSCHKVGGAVSPSGVISCNDCHTAYPHTEGYAAPGLHGVQFVGIKEADRATTCLSCHSPTVTGDKKPTNCSTCHTAYPFAHTNEFKTEGGGSHAVLAKSYAGKCTTCHTDFKRNMPSTEGVGCGMCHEVDKFKIGFP